MKPDGKVLQKILNTVTKPKKNTPPKIGGRSDGGRYVEAPESWRREFRILENPVVTDTYVMEKILGDYGHSSMSDSPERGDVRSNPEVATIEEDEEIGNQKKRDRSQRRMSALRDKIKGRRGRNRGGRKTEPTPNENRDDETPKLPSLFTPDVSDDGGWPVDPPWQDGVVPFDIPDDEEPNKEDKERREETAPTCQEVEEELRNDFGIEITLCGGKGLGKVEIVGNV